MFLIKKFKNIVYLYGPQHRFYNYFLLADYVFGIEELIVIENLDKIKDSNCEIFIDQNYLNEFLLFKFSNFEKEINILLWNDEMDYELHKNSIEEVKLKFKRVNVFFHSNFYLFRENTIALNNFKINQKNSLKKITGIGFTKKIKYFYPFFYSIYNLLINYNYSFRFIFKNKLIFVGRSSKEDLFNAFKKCFPSKKDLINCIHKDINNYSGEKKIKILFDVFETQDFKSLKFYKKYYLANVVIRFILIDYLKRFINFYHKKDKRFNLDFLHSHLYKKSIMLDTGSKVGNTKIYPRGLLINKFYNNQNIRINFFLNNINYNLNDGNFENRLKMIKNALGIFLNYKNFGCSVENLLSKLNELDKNIS